MCQKICAECVPAKKIKGDGVHSTFFRCCVCSAHQFHFSQDAARLCFYCDVNKISALKRKTQVATINFGFALFNYRIVVFCFFFNKYFISRIGWSEQTLKYNLNRYRYHYLRFIKHAYPVWMGHSFFFFFFWFLVWGGAL